MGMRRVAGRLQTLGAGVLVLAVSVAAPGLSAAQNSAPAEEPVPATPAPEAPPLEPDPAASGGGEDGSDPGIAERVTGQSAASTTAPQPQKTPQAKSKAKASASKTVSVGDNFYTPVTVSITVGDTVTWKNDGAAVHTATADDGSFDTGVFDPGQSRSETFTSTGDISYFCTIHGQVQSGTVKVLAASGGGGSGGGGGSTTSGSEAAAVASPGAAGSSSSLPATGFAAAILAAVGFSLIACGSLLSRLGGRTPRGRLFSL